jgi:hypothetical protein
MPEIVLTEEQARVVAEATGPVTVRNPAGEIVGFIYPQGTAGTAKPTDPTRPAA